MKLREGRPLSMACFAPSKFVLEAFKKDQSVLTFRKNHQGFFTNFQMFLSFIQKSSGKRWIKQIREKTAIDTHSKTSLQALPILDKIPVFC